MNSENLNKTVNEKILTVANSKNSKNNILLIKSYREFVDLFYQHKEGMLHTLLYNNVKIVSFDEGKVVFNAETETLN